jgi:hypothetical protein
MNCFTGFSSGRIIDRLWRDFGGKWRYDRDTRSWRGPKFDVSACSQLVSMTPNGYDHCTTVYVRSDNGATLPYGSGRVYPA